MSISPQRILQFRTFVCDDTLTDAQISKYLIWGKDSLEMALNYYYAPKDNNKPKQTQPRNNPSAWDKLKDGAKKQKQTQQHIQMLKKQYKLPVVSKGNSKQYFSKGSSRFSDVDFLPNLMTHQKEEQIEIGENEYQSDIQSDQQSKVDTKMIQNIQRMQQQKPVNSKVQIKKLEIKPFFQPASLKKDKQKQSKQSQLGFDKIRSSYSKPSAINSYFNQNDSVYLGQCFIDAFAVSKQDLSKYRNQQIKLKPFSNKKPEKGKRGTKVKVADNKVIIRVSWNDLELGRFQDNESRIFCPLLVDGYISMKCWLFDPPVNLREFTRYKLRSEIFLQRKSITKPIVQTFENQKTQNPILMQFKQIKQQLNSLFIKLNLQILTHPLIQLKSKYETSNRQIRREDQKNQFEEKSTKQLVEKLTNPFYKQVQVTLNMGSKNGTSFPKKIEQKPVIKDQQYNVEIKQDQYQQLINLNQCSLQPTTPSPIFTSDLHYYQSIALTWTLFRQGFYKKQTRQQLHPMWTQFKLTQSDPLFFNQFTGQLSIQPPIHKDQCKGGILADEMGLGKTVMMIALIATNSQNKSKYKTLIVVPLTLLDQWQSEIATHTKYNSLRVYKYYQKKCRNQSLQNYDVVITTYGVVSNQFAQGLHVSKQGLFKHQWFRVILDQAHYIKGRVIQTSRAVFSLKSQINWCLTGTPIQNKLDDIYSLIHFIRYTPWSDYTWWNNYINKPHNQNDLAVYPVLRTILKNILLRRTKQSKLQNGEYIINLPPKVSKIKYLTMKQKQRQFYDAVYQSSKKQFDQLQSQGVVEAKYMKILQILIRLRQICCHPILFKSISKLNNVDQFEQKLSKFIQKKLSDRNSAQNDPVHFQLLMEGDQQIVVNPMKLKVNHIHMKQVVQAVRTNTLQNCRICLGQVDNPVITICMHVFCRTCLIQTINNIRGFCPLCRTVISKDDFIHLPHDNRLRMDFKSGFERSTKMQALIDLITGFQQQDKVVVFSQFLGMIDLIQQDFKRNKIQYVRMDGSLSQKQRGIVIQKFKKDLKCKVFIISLKSGGVGLNLVVANKVILVDPWWNPAVQEQAIERVHRIGQKRSVQVWRLIITNSIQSRMMQLHQSKRNVSNMAMSQKQTTKQNFAQKFKYLMSKY